MPTDLEPTVDTWQGYARQTVMLHDRSALIVAPTVAPAAGRPWIWRTMFFGAFPSVDLRLLELGWHVVFGDCYQELGSPRELDQLDAVYDWATREHGLSLHPVLEGFSRGGLYALNWAIRHPALPASIYLDAPVCDFRTWPYGGPGAGRFEDGWKAVLRGYGLTEAEALSGTHIPLARLEAVLERATPFAIVAGAADATVPWSTNGAVLMAMLEDAGAPHQLWLKPDCDHHPHSLDDPSEVVAFLQHHAPGG